MPAKMQTVNKLKGVNFHQLRQLPDLHDETATYAVDDAGKCKALFLRWMQEGFPKEELKVIDWVIRMVTQPQLEFDQTVLAEHLADVKAKKQALLTAASLEADNVSSIMSDAQLAAKLLMLGADIPMKTSAKTGKNAYAFAKTDREFIALLEHPEADGAGAGGGQAGAQVDDGGDPHRAAAVHQPANQHGAGAPQVQRRAHPSLLR